MLARKILAIIQDPDFQALKLRHLEFYFILFPMLILIVNIVNSGYFIEYGGLSSEGVRYMDFTGKVRLSDWGFSVGDVNIVFERSRNSIDLIPDSSDRIGINSFTKVNGKLVSNHANAFARVVYKNLYEGIDAVVGRSKDGSIELQWIVNPQSNPGKIRLRIEAKDVFLDEGGNLVVGDLVISAPRAYQGSEEVEVHYDLSDDGIVTLKVGDYDPRYPLIIDPSIVVGGEGLNIYVDDVVQYNGTIYVLAHGAWLDSLDVNGYERHGTSSGDYDALILALDPSSGNVVSGTFLKGSEEDVGYDLEVNSNGVFVAGVTHSADFPVTNGSSHSGRSDAFVAILDHDLTHLLKAGYLGGSRDDAGYAFCFSSGSIFLTGSTKSDDLPVSSDAYMSSRPDAGKNASDIFILSLDMNLNPTRGTYIGGDGTDIVFDIECGNSSVYITGYTKASDYPTNDGYDTALDGGMDAFVSRLSLDLRDLYSSTYLGGGRYEYGYDLAISPSGDVYVVGATYSSDFPTTSGAYQESEGDDSWYVPDGFVSKLSSDLATLLKSTYVGGGDAERIYDIAITAGGNVIVSGLTASNNLNLPSSAYDGTFNGGADAFLLLLDSDLENALGGTYLGGSHNDGAVRGFYDLTYRYRHKFDEYGAPIFIGNGDTVVIALWTSSVDFPGIGGGISGYRDAVVVIMDTLFSELRSAGFVGDAIFSSSYERVEAIKVIGEYVYAVGYTSSPRSFGISGVYNSFSGGNDAFVMKLDTAFHILSITYLGGILDDKAEAVDVASDGSVYVTGITQSPDFPVTTGAHDTHFDGSSDIFVAHLNADLDNLLASTYLGGSASDEARAIVVVGDTGVYIQGHSYSADFPSAVNSLGGRDDVVVALMNADLTRVISSIYVGGSSYEQSDDMVLGPDGFLYLTGETTSTDFPVSSGAYQSSIGGYYDAFVARIDPEVTQILNATYLGGRSSDYGNGIAVDMTGNVYVVGGTRSRDFPMEGTGEDQTFGGNVDVFVSKLNSTFTDLLASTYLGKSKKDIGECTAIGPDGKIYVGGTTSSSNYPVSSDAYDKSYNGGGDAIITALNPDLTIAYSTFFGGSNYETFRDIEITPQKVYAGGYTNSSDFPIRLSYSGYETFHGDLDATVVSFDLELTPVDVQEDYAEIKIAGKVLNLNMPMSGYLGLDVYTPAGKLILRKSFGYVEAGSYSVDLTGLPAGTYLIEVRTGDKVKTVKVSIY